MDRAGLLNVTPEDLAFYSAEIIFRALLYNCDSSGSTREHSAVPLLEAFAHSIMHTKCNFACADDADGAFDMLFLMLIAISGGLGLYSDRMMVYIEGPVDYAALLLHILFITRQRKWRIAHRMVYTRCFHHRLINFVLVFAVADAYSDAVCSQKEICVWVSCTWIKVCMFFVALNFILFIFPCPILSLSKQFYGKSYLMIDLH